MLTSRSLRAVVNAEQILKETHATFLSSLSSAEAARFKTCSSVGELLQSSRTLEAIAKDRIRGQGFFARIKAFADSLAPYFPAINVLVSSNPQYAALVWGSLRLILQMASNYASFFDKLTQSLSLLGHQLPQVETLVCLSTRYHGVNLEDSLKDALVEVYVGVFEFLTSIARVFTGRNGKYKNRATISFGVAWKPFNIRFDEILQRVSDAATKIKDMVALNELRASIEEREKAEQERQAAVRDRTAAAKARVDDEMARAATEIDRKTLLTAYEKSEAKDAEKDEINRQRAEALMVRQENSLAAIEARLLQLDILARKAEQEQERLHSLKLGIEASRRDDAFDRLKHWIAPPEYMQELERLIQERERGTADWILQAQEFLAWKDDVSTATAPSKFQRECLWVQGNPGCGKSVLAATVLEELRCSSEETTLYFFFHADSANANTTLPAYRALVAQILHHHRHDYDTIDRFAFAMNEKSGGQLVASKFELLDLLQTYFAMPGKCSVVLDGIDECEDNDNLLSDVLSLRLQSQTRFALFSRPTVAKLANIVPEAFRLQIARNAVPDIRLYLKKALQSFVDDNSLPRNATVDELVQNLVVGADGMFLWARLMIKYLSSPILLPKQRVKIIRNVTFPEGLEAMYDRIGALIHAGVEEGRRLADTTLMWLAFAARELTARELHSVVRLNEALSDASGDDHSSVGDSEEDDDDFLGFVTSVIFACSGLVITDTTKVQDGGSQELRFRFSHLSAREYVLGNVTRGHATARKHIVIDPTVASITMAQTCLRYLMYRLPAQPLGGDVGSHASLDFLTSSFPFGSYAALLWPRHLSQVRWPYLGCLAASDAGISELYVSLARDLSMFLSQKFVLMAWIEALYICGWRNMAQDFEACSQSLKAALFPAGDEDILRGLRIDMEELNRYLMEVHSFWGAKLTKSPESIWDEVTAFTQSPLIAQTRAIQVHSLVSARIDDASLSTVPLCKSSRSNSDGTLDAIISIYPSRCVYPLLT